jgi:non-specific serine/threonine protein kinase
MAEPGKCGLKIQLLGAFEIWREDLLIPLQAQSRGKAPAILKVLLSERGRVFSQDQLIEVLFSDLEPAKAAHNLHARISELRRALEPELKQGSDSQFIRSAGKQGYCFPKDAPCSLDTEEFQNHYQTAQAAERTGRWAEALEGYQQAVQLYRGDYLAEDPYEEWTLASREEWRELFLNALLRLADCQAHLGQYAEALETCRKAIKQKPSAEAATRQMMIYHCLLGEHSAALQAYRECAKALEKELEVQPSPETEKLHEAILKGRMPELEKLYPRPTVAAPARHNLPSALTSFIGRGREMLKIKDLLNSSRLLTLAGIGGCGKTRLALQVAGDLVEEYSDGVWLVELAALSDPKLVPQALASTLGVREQAGRPLMETLADHLQAKCLLLVLDNCEHLLAACAQLADALLRRSPHLRILATSRETLGITGEVNFPVPPMARPDQDQLPPLKQLAEHEAVRLFVERALSSQPHFALTDQNAPVVVQICHRLDGLPLAIELAAAQVKVLSAEQIAQRLDERFRLLTGGSRTALPRQQTLQGTMDWSWELLAQPEQVMFRRLSVFAGGFALEAAEAVCAGEGIEKSEVLGQLTSLVETSLVIFGGRDGEVSYTLLETVQQYAGDKLRESREMDHLQVRHLAFFLQLAERAEAELTGPDQKAWFDQLEVEHDNLRAALNWSTRAEGDAETALRLAGALGRFWEVRGYFAEGRDALGRALAGTEQLRSGLRVKALWWAGALAHRQGDYEQAKKLSTESLQLSRELGDKRCIALSLNSLGIVTCDQGDFTEAQRFHEESLALRRELGDKGGIASSLNNLGTIARDQGDFTEAQRFHEESLA